MNPLSPDQEKRDFLDEMLGKDFPISHKVLRDTYSERVNEEGITVIATELEEFKENIMALLQKKSFNGLYLRLQFWVNQICKSIYGNINSDPESEPSMIGLHSV